VLAGTEPSLTWVGHATFLLRLAGKTVLTDPVWSERIGPGVRRNMPPGLALDPVLADAVLISHNHRDHLDEPTLRRLGQAPTYVVPLGNGPRVGRRSGGKVVELDWWGTTEVAGLEVTLVPAQHWSQRGLLDRNRTLWGGFVVRGGGKSVYFAGDSAYFSGFAEIGRRFPQLDVALLPVGAYDPEWFMRRQHLSPADAMQAFVDLGARRLVAMHWGTFKLSDEPLDEPPVLLEAARRDRGIEAERVWVMAIGETRRL
jgi:L-ascorbate metabolism protein UlaG (beta-lactamase superfamily)